MQISDLIDIIKLPFRKEKELFSSLRAIIGFYPRHIEYYKLALMHKSIARRNAKGCPLNNERLEFLGDAILDAVAGDIVFRHFEGKREGFLTVTRSKLVQRETLGKLAQEMGIDRLVLTSTRNNTHNSYMGGNAFEALVGAIYLDRGYDACMRFMKKRILAQLINIDKMAYKEMNFKSKLIEWSQKNRVSLTFHLVNQLRDAKGNPVFRCRAILEGVEGSTGEGFSKKEAHQQAAKETLRRLRREPQFIDAVFAAKGNRTKMEEEPVSAAPDVESSQQPLAAVGTPCQTANDTVNNTEPNPLPTAAMPAEDNALSTTNPATVENDSDAAEQTTAGKSEPSPFDFSDITLSPEAKSKEDIIAAAEALAFGEEEQAV